MGINVSAKSLLIHGAKGGGKGGSGGGGNEAPNTLRSKATARILDLLGEGEIKGLVDGAKSIYLDETPLMAADGTYNFEGVKWDIRTGLPDQPIMNGAKGVEATTNVGATVKKGSPAIRSLSDPDYDSCVVTVRIPALSHANDKGDINPTSVTFRIDIRYQGGPWSTTSGDITISGKCTSPYDRQYYFALPKNPSGDSAPWDIRMTRITADSDEIRLQNDIIFAAFTGNIEAKFTYPHTAYVGIVIDGEQFNQQIPNRSYLVDGRIISVPSNYTPRQYDKDGNITVPASYSGIWDGTFKEAWTNNPAWVYYDMTTNDRFGLGDYIDVLQVDKWSLYEIGIYCDGLVPDGYGGMEPRMTFNAVISDKREAYDTLSTMANCFRGMAYWSSGSIYTSADMPKEPDFPAGPANVIDANFERQSSAKKARHTVAMVKWNDPVDFYRAGYEVYQNEDGIRRYGYRDTEMVATGCTSRGQAHRMGKWAVLTELFEKSTINYQAGFDHAGVRPGDIVAVQDPSQAGVDYSGRLTGNPSEMLKQRTLRTEDWSLFAPASGTATISEGVMTLKGGSGGVSSYADQQIVTVPGRAYRVSVRTLDPQALIIMVGTSLAGTQRLNQTTPAAAGVYVYTFTATTALTYLRLRRTVTTAMTLTDVSVLDCKHTYSTVELDTDIVFDAGKTYYLTLQMPDGSIQERTIAPTAFGQPLRTINVSSPFGKLANPQSMWVISRNDLEPELFRVITIKENGKNIYDVMALQYEPSKFAAVDEDMAFELINTSDLPTGPLGKPTNFSFVEYPAALGDTGTVIAVDFSVTAPKDPRIANLQWQIKTPISEGSTEMTDWQDLSLGPDPTITVQGLPKGTYSVRVRCLSTLGGFSGWLIVDSVYLVGADFPPPDVTDFRISVLGAQSVLSWSLAGTLNVAYLEIRHTPSLSGAVWASSIILLDKANGNSVQVPTLQGTYSIKSVSYGGTYSENTAFVVNEIKGTETLNIVEVFQENPTFIGGKSNTAVDTIDLVLAKDSNGLYYPEGSYTLSQELDLGDVYTSRVSALLQVFGIDKRDTMSTWTRLSDVESLANAASDLWDLLFEYQITNDNPVATVARSSIGWYFNKFGNLVQAAVNQPRENYDPNNIGADPVVLEEPASTNRILNNTFNGVPLGTPNGYTGSIDPLIPAGVTAQIVSKGTENGIDYADVRFSGTVTSANWLGVGLGGFQLTGVRNVVFSAFAKLVAGTIPMDKPDLYTDVQNSSGGYVGNYRKKLNLDGKLRRYSNAFSTPASSNYFTNYILSWADVGQVIDVTIRYALPQLEERPAGVTEPTTPMKTSGSAFTRAAETIIAKPTWSGWKTLITSDIKFRSIRFRLKLFSFNPYITPGVRRLEISIDMPDRVTGAEDVVAPTTGLRVDFVPPYKSLKGVAISAQGLLTGDYYEITQKDAYGFNIVFKNASGNTVQRTLDYVATGYGRIAS